MSDPGRSYEVVALPVPIVYDRHGDHDRNGTIYALAGDEPELRAIGQGWPEPFPDPLEHPDEMPHPHPLVCPLVLRATVGERVVVDFRNELPRRAGIHPQGVRYDVERADGGVVGYNPDSAADPRGGRRRYVWDCDREGVFFFGDLADLRGSEQGSQAHGLFGALVVEPDGAVWTDPVTGEPSTGGLYADVHVPGEPSFREYVAFLQDQAPNDNAVDPPHAVHRCEGPRPHTHAPAAGGQRLPPEPFGGRDGSADHGSEQGAGDDGDGSEHAEPTSMTLMSYRTEPTGWRSPAFERLVAAGALDPVRDAVVGEEQQHSSWLFGDPATPVLRAYAGDRARIRLVHAGVKETHVFHLHLHRWRAVPGDECSPIVDSIGIGPQQAFTIEPVAGAGSVQRAAGDVIWQCHPHSGAWGIWRVFDVAQDGTGRYPDGTSIERLRPLPGHEPPPLPTPERPGFPAFLPGVFPQRSPRPPRTPSMPPGMGREPTALERAAFCADPQPGEAFTKVASDPDAPVRRYDLVVLQGTIGYFRGEHTGRSDHRGVLFVLAEEIEQAGGVEAFRAQLEAGEREVAPIAIRAARGEVVELSLTNALPPGCQEATAFDPVLPFQPECGLHVHLVSCDPLVADGAAVGWNYLSGTTTADAGAQDHERYRTWIYRWYCAEEFGTVFFHDHLLAGNRQRHGLFGCLVVEPAGARWSDPHEPGREVANATRAVVRMPDGTSFREQVLGVADSVPMGAHGHGGPGGGGDAADPPSSPGARGDRGAMAVGYRCEPLAERPGDPADWFSSTVHGDPGTPLLRAYPGEDIRLRLYQGSHEQRHSFVAHGLRWRAGHDVASSPPRNQQTIGTSEAFSLHVDEGHGPGDHLWSFAANDDTWLGCWGLVRMHDVEIPDLPALPTAFRDGGPAAFDPAAFDPAAFDPAAARRYHVRVRARQARYSASRTDPLALAYTVDGGPADEPLVLRARVGEWVEVTLTNELPGPPPPSPFDPRLPAEEEPADRVVSERVSLQAGGLRYDVRDADGSAVGHNPDTTVKPGHSVTYRWYADAPGAFLLSDRADVRTHRHRGLVGVLVVEPPDVTPHDPAGDEIRWVGEQAVLRRPGRAPERELVLLLTDGLRLYHDGDLTQPVRDLEDDPDDSGQKAFNHRSAHLLPARPSLADPHPPTPTLACAPGDLIRVHLVVAADRPRNHSFTIHGHDWPVGEHRPDVRVGAIGALSTGSVRSLRLTAGAPGDYAYRTGALRWALAEGLWGLIRVR